MAKTTPLEKELSDPTVEIMRWGDSFVFALSPQSLRIYATPTFALQRAGCGKIAGVVSFLTVATLRITLEPWYRQMWYQRFPMGTTRFDYGHWGQGVGAALLIAVALVVYFGLIWRFRPSTEYLVAEIPSSDLPRRCIPFWTSAERQNLALAWTLKENQSVFDPRPAVYYIRSDSEERKRQIEKMVDRIGVRSGVLLEYRSFDELPDYLREVR